MIKSLGSLCLLSCLALSAFADTFKLPESKPVISFVLPDSWNPTATAAGLEAVSVDNEIYLAVEFVDEDSIKDVFESDRSFLKDQGVTIEEKQQAEPDTMINKMPVMHKNFNGTDKEGPCDVSLSIIEVAQGQALVIMYWGSPNAAEKHKDSLEKIMNSMTKI